MKEALLGRSRSGLTGKIHLTAGQAADSPRFAPITERDPRPSAARPGAVTADEAASSRANRAHPRKRHIKAVIPEKEDRATHREKSGELQHQHAAELAEFLRKPCGSREECRALQEQVDVAATVITTLLSENRSLRGGQVGNGARVVVPMPRHDVPRA